MTPPMIEGITAEMLQVLSRNNLCECSICGSGNYSPRTLLQHNRIFHPTDKKPNRMLGSKQPERKLNNVCTFCKEKFPSRMELENHRHFCDERSRVLAKRTMI